MQFSGDEYIFFDAKEASVRSMTSRDDSGRLPRGCWCICDGNGYVEVPCRHFMRPGLFTCLVTSPNPKRYIKWRKETNPMVVITALPRTVEVAAIAWVLQINSCLFSPHLQPPSSQKSSWLSAKYGLCSPTKVGSQCSHHHFHPPRATS